MPYYLFTFRPQISEQDLFEQFLVIFIPILKKFPKWTYSVEDDQKLTKHIHAVFEHPTAKDKTAMEQLFNKKIFRDFKKSIKYKQTNDAGFDNQKIKEEDLMKVIGYVNKQDGCLRREYNFTNQYIIDCIKYYYVSDHIDKSNKIGSDWTILTTKNAHVIIDDYIKKNNIEEIKPILKIRMIKDKFSFINFSKEKQEQLFNEIAIAMLPNNSEDEQFCEEQFVDYKNSFLKARNEVIRLREQIQFQAMQLKELGAL